MSSVKFSMKMGKPKKEVSTAFKQKHKKNRQNKTFLKFDEQARVDYLTGFRKRKNERKKKAQEEMLQQLKEEKRRIKEKKRAEMRERLKPFEDALKEDGLECLVTPHTYSLPEQTVTVTDVTEVDYVGSSGLLLGTNKGQASDEEQEEEEAGEKSDEDMDSKAASGSNNKPGKGEKHFHKSGKMKRLWKPQHKQHKNYSHAAHKHKRASGREERSMLKRKLKKKHRNKPN